MIEDQTTWRRPELRAWNRRHDKFRSLKGEESTVIKRETNFRNSYAPSLCPSPGLDVSVFSSQISIPATRSLEVIDGNNLLAFHVPAAPRLNLIFQEHSNRSRA